MSLVDSWQLSQNLKQLCSVWLILVAIVISTLAAVEHLVLIWMDSGFKEQTLYQLTDLIEVIGKTGLPLHNKSSIESKEYTVHNLTQHLEMFSTTGYFVNHDVEIKVRQLEFMRK